MFDPAIVSTWAQRPGQRGSVVLIRRFTHPVLVCDTAVSTFSGLLCLRESGDITGILTWVTNMSRLKILPGAAGVIALTVAMGFVDGKRDVEPASLSRGRVTLVGSMTQIADVGALPGKQIDLKPDSPAYLVQIRRGNTNADVLIDAVTGKILLS